jgi:modulator of FtsH protease HflK
MHVFFDAFLETVMAFRIPALLNSQDPWRKRRDSQGSPPDLEAMIANFFKKFVGAKHKSSGASPTGPVLKAPMIRLGLGVLLLLWALSGIYQVQQAEQGVVLRFGRYVRTVEPGLHWMPQLIERRIVMNVQQVSQFSYNALMLTKDENIVSVELSVQYRIDQLYDFLFNVRDPVLSLNEATASALRHVVGHTDLDDLLTTGREGVRDQIMQQLRKILGIYKPGLLVSKVSLQPAKPPEQVTDAFNDAIKAREDEQRYINQANAYANKVLPIAQGHVVRLTETARAFARELELRAQGETARFLALLPEYKRSPAVMRKRMYLATIETILSHTTKVLVDLKGNNMFYLPFDKLLGQGARSTQSGTSSVMAADVVPPVDTAASAAASSSQSSSVPSSSGGGYGSYGQYSQSAGNNYGQR